MQAVRLCAVKPASRLPLAPFLAERCHPATPCLHRGPTRRPRRLTRALSTVSSDTDADDLSSLARHLQEGYDILMPKDLDVLGVGHIPVQSVPPHIARPRYAQGLGGDVGYTPDSTDGDGRIELGGEQERKLRRAALLAKEVLRKAGELVQIGRTADEIDSLLHNFITSRSAYPSPLLYHGFPKSCCTSVNNVIAHGIPDNRPLEPGDIINVDITVYLDGYHGDTSRTFLCGEVDARGRALVEATEDALLAGMLACGPSRPFRDIGRAIQESLRGRKGMSVSRQFSGHGIGTVFHRSPWILHHANDEPGVMLPGHCFTIEPAIVDDEDSRGWMWPDDWTVSTETGARSAQAEHMVLITERGYDVLTL